MERPYVLPSIAVSFGSSRPVNGTGSIQDDSFAAGSSKILYIQKPKGVGVLGSGGGGAGDLTEVLPAARIGVPGSKPGAGPA